MSFPNVINDINELQINHSNDTSYLNNKTNSLEQNVNNIRATYLPLSGGIMTGAIHNAAGYYSFTNNSSYKELLFGGYDGGRIALRAGDAPSGSGVCVITTVNPTTKEEKHMVPHYDGNLWWDNNRVICEHYYSNNRNGWMYCSNGVAYVWGYVGFETNIYQMPVTFPYPMINASYNVWGSCYTSVGDVIAMGADLTTTGFLFVRRRSYDLKYDFYIGASYFVIGRWK